MFKNKTLPWKTAKPNFVAFFVLVEMAFSLFYFFAQTFQKLGHHVKFVYSYATQEYPRIFLDGEPISMHEKHFTGLVHANGILYLPNK